MASLQAALPGSYYTDDAHWRREADQVLHREWFCAGRLSTWGLETGTHGRLAVVDVAGESILVTRTREGGLRPSSTSAGTGARRSSPSTPTAGARSVRGRRAALPVPLLDL